MNKKGFTIVELLAVMVILALIIVLISTNVLSSKKKADQKLMDLEEEKILNSAITYYNDLITTSDVIINKDTECVVNISTLKNKKFFQNDKYLNSELNDNVYVKIKDSKSGTQSDIIGANSGGITSCSTLIENILLNPTPGIEPVEKWDIGKVIRTDVIAYLYKNIDIKGVNDNLYTLKIVGKGDMLDFAKTGNIAPWISKYKAKISDVDIDKGVTNVGSYAFYNHTNLEYIKFSNTVAKINDYAFNSCTKLSKISIPASMQIIGKNAFEKSKNLKTLTFESSSKIKTIDEKAFSECGIEDLIIPASTETINKSAFYNNKTLKTLAFEKNSKLKAIRESAFDTCNIESLTIPASLELIGRSAFTNNLGLKTLGFEKNSKLKTIGHYAFYKDDIEYLIIPASLETIGNYAFSNNSNLKALGFEINSKIKSINSGAFSGCDIEGLSLPASLETIGSSAFYRNEHLKTLKFENNSKLKIISFSAFRECDVNSLSIPSSLETIDNSAFSTNKNLKTLTFENNSKLKTIGNNAFEDNSIGSLKIPASLEKIGDYAFKTSYVQSGNNWGCPYTLKSLTFESDSKLKSIGSYAFKCAGINSITFPNLLETIGSYAFNTSSLSSVTFNPSLKTIGNGAFAATRLSSVTLNSGLTSIGGSAFSNTYIRTLNIPASVSEINGYIIHGEYISSINVDEKSQYFTSVNGVLYDKNKTRVINVPDTYGHRSSLLDLPDTVVKIDGGAIDGWLWYGSYGSFTIDLPSSITEVDVGMFSVNSFTINGKRTNTTDNAVYAVQDGVLYSRDLKTMIRMGPRYSSSHTVPNTTTKIADEACSYNIATPSITINNSVNEIGSSAFYSYVNHGGLRTINLYTNDNLKFGKYSFEPERLNNESANTRLYRTINVKSSTLKENLENNLYKDDYITYSINVVK